ncbi:MAG: protein kinase [Chthoniobacterales bacterium]|nr:protein kinase [Chthoniobacterales bacterium]
MLFDQQQVNDLFDEAVELTGAERVEFLELKCAGNRKLRAEVESLLAADADLSRFIENPILSIPPEIFPDASTELTGQQVGSYRIVREIGRGGLGRVYLAERADDAYRKQVAIKLIRRGLDTEDILSRFRNERQILAQLDHPNIARLIDGGTTADGLPYFVMEYVPGRTLLDFCHARQLDTNARLQLFRQVCAAVSYAHQNLVIHRDLKPSNIVVTEDGAPKLLDFGIAKLLTSDEEAFTQTVPGLRVMTPEYASPEQVKGDRVTTSSDVYSLGVVLYELLTGQKPYRLTSRSAEEIARAITGQTPERPSTVVAHETGSAGRRENRALRGDLDRIVLMALRKEPERRYSSAAALADDIERHLTGRPVVAHQDTFAYRASKFVRRHKAGALAAALILLAILAGITATLWQSRQTNQQRVQAERRFNDVRKLANSNLFEVYPEVENLAGSLKAREIILTNALQYLDSLAKEAAGDLDLQGELATGYEKVGDVQGALNNSNLGNTEAGLETYRKANVLRAAIVAARPEDLEARKKLANNQYTTARTLWMASKTKEAEEAFEKTLKLQRELVAASPESAEFKDKLAVVLIDYGAIPAFNSQSEKALRLFNEALRIVDDLQARDPANVAFRKTKARLLRILSKSKGATGDYAGALKDLETALVLSREVAQKSPDDFRAQRAVWLSETMICEHFIDQGDGERAVQACAGTIDFPREALEKEPENGVVAYDLAISHFNLARAQRLAGDFSATIRNAEAAVQVMARLSAKSPNDADYLRNLAIYKTEMARAQIALQRSDVAIAALQEARETLQPIVTADPNSATTLGDLGMAYRLLAQAHHQKGESGKAVELVEQAIAVSKNLLQQNSIRDSEKGQLAELEQEKAQYAAARSP